jgi:tripartite-type tricarboxylate transporter receptor subunit TctC
MPGNMGRKSQSMRQMRSLLLAVAGLLAVLASPVVAQQDYPNRPIRMIIPFPPGGSNDIVGRAIATQMGEKLGKQVIVDNRTGAAAIVGTEIASKAPADGYTILVISLAHAYNPWLYKLPYDPIKAFTPIGIMAAGTNALTVHPSLPVHSVNDLIVMAKAKPGELTYASSGVGTFQHLTAELFKLETKIDLLHVPFRGGGPALTDVLGGHNKIMFSSVVNVVPHVKSGRLRALGTGGAQRAAALPDVPTIAEAGVPGYEANQWWGLLAPAGTPAAIVARLHKALEEVQDMPEIQQQFEKEGASIKKMGSAEFGKFIESEMNKWERVVKESGIKAE